MYNSSCTHILTKSFKGFGSNIFKGSAEKEDGNAYNDGKYFTDKLSHGSYQIETGHFDTVRGNVASPLSPIV